MSSEDSSDNELFAAISNSSKLSQLGKTLPDIANANAAGPSLWSSSDEDDPGESSGSFSSNFPSKTMPQKVKMVDKYIIGAKIGEGAYAVVREGLNVETLRIVAVKVVDMRRLRKIRGGVENMKREVKVQKTLKRHPQLIELLSVYEDTAKSKCYLFMEMGTGCTVQELIDRAPGKRLSTSQAAYILHQTLSGLLYMHRRGIVHRDIKPSNIMLNANSEVKIADFGVAEFLDQYDREDNVTRTSGSPAFQAPEIANGEEGYSGMKVDVWAVGVSAYFMLVGRIPFESDNLLGLFRAIAAGKYNIPTELGESICDAIQQMLRVDWHERPSVEELLRHPWIARADRLPSPQKQEEDDWVKVPRKHFTVLEVANNMVAGGKSACAAPTASPEGVDKFHGLHPVDTIENPNPSQTQPLDSIFRENSVSDKDDECSNRETRHGDVLDDHVTQTNPADDEVFEDNHNTSNCLLT